MKKETTNYAKIKIASSFILAILLLSTCPVISQAHMKPNSTNSEVETFIELNNTPVIALDPNGIFPGSPDIRIRRWGLVGFGEWCTRLGVNQSLQSGQLQLDSYTSLNNFTDANNNPVPTGTFGPSFDMISLAEHNTGPFGSNPSVDFTWHIGVIDALEFSGGTGTLDPFDAVEGLTIAYQDGGQSPFYMYSFDRNGDFQTASDKNLKSNIKDLDSSKDKFAQLSPKSYKYKWVEDDSKKKSVGFLAQDVQKLFPDLVSSIQQPNGDKTLMINYIGLIPHMTKAIQEHVTENEDLKKRIEVLEKLVLDR